MRKGRLLDLPAGVDLARPANRPTPDDMRMDMRGRSRETRGDVIEALPGRDEVESRGIGVRGRDPQRGVIDGDPGVPGVDQGRGAQGDAQGGDRGTVAPAATLADEVVIGECHCVIAVRLRVQ